MNDEQIPYEEIRRRVEARIKRRTRLVSNMAVVIVLNVFVWAAWAFTDPQSRISLWVPLFLSAACIISFISDVIGLVMGEWQERAIQREIERERQWLLQMAEKTKRDDAAYVRLSDDGELVEIDDYEDADKRKHRSEG